MHTFNIKIAGISITVNSLYDEILSLCKDYLTNEPPEFSVTVSKDDIDFEREKSKAEFEYENLEYPDFTPGELEVTSVYRKIANILPKYDAIVFHGAAVAVGNNCYLFTAKSGTGKTTHIRLWLKNIQGSYVVNGDKPILRIIDGKVYACGTPWRGKEGYGCNSMVQLESICILNRGTENIITPVRLNSVANIILGQSYRPSDRSSLLKTIEIINKISKRVSLYSLECNMNDDAATVSYEGMTNDELC